MDTDEVQLAPKVVVIIGNGFDLDLKLKTRYYDFVLSPSFKPLYSPYRDVFKLFMDTGRYMDKLVLTNNRLAKQIIDSIVDENKKWIDLEIEIRNFCKLHKDEEDKNLIQREIFSVRYLLYKYIQFTDANKSQFLQDREVGKTTMYNVLSLLQSANADVQFWNFNYTSTCEVLMEKLRYNGNHNQIHYVHGSVLESQKNQEINIVLGTRYEEDVARCCRSAIKSQMADENYTANVKLLKQHLSEAESLILLGFGMGETDRQYFEEWLPAENKLQNLLIVDYTSDSINNVLDGLDIASNNMVSKRFELGSLNIMRFETLGFVEAYGFVNQNKVQKLEQYVNQCVSYPIEGEIDAN